MHFSRRRKWAFFSVALLAVLMGSIHACTFRMSSHEINRYFRKRNQVVNQLSYEHEWREMHYISAGKQDGALVIFVHGSPGSLSAFIDFVADTVLQQDALLISCDRPGFGYSNFGMAERSLRQQARALKPILEKHKHNRPLILVGHSLGGPVIARMAIDYPELIDGLIIVAGSIDPDLEPNETWFRAPLATPFFSWILPRSFRASNEEIYHLKTELTELMPEWKKIQCPVTIIQGDKDFLVPKENAVFGKKMMVNTKVKLITDAEMGHFVPWTHPYLIREAILEMIRRPNQIGTQSSN